MTFLIDLLLPPNHKHHVLVHHQQHLLRMGLVQNQVLRPKREAFYLLANGRLTSSLICADAKLHHNNRAHPIDAGLRGESPIAIMTEWYINHDWHRSRNPQEEPYIADYNSDDYDSDDDDVPPLGNYDRDDEDEHVAITFRGDILRGDGGDQSNPQQPADVIDQTTCEIEYHVQSWDWSDGFEPNRRPRGSVWIQTIEYRPRDSEWIRTID